VSELWPLALSHLRLTVLAVTLASLIGGGIGLASQRSRRLARIALVAASLVQTIPALALLAVMVPALAFIGARTGAPISGIGELPALIGLTLYAILPVARAVVLGIESIAPSVRAAALAVGMTPGQRLRLVELPLAAASIVGGIRTATAWTVGMATLATPVGATSLGNLIFGGLQTRHYDQVALGCAGSAGMALLLDGLLALCARPPQGRRTLVRLGFVMGMGGAAALLAGLTSLTWLPRMAAASRPVRVGAKSFAEQLVLAEVLRCAIAADADAGVDVRSSLGSTVAFDALRHNELDVYVEYTGTAWLTLLHETERLERSALRQAVERELAARFGIHVAAHLGFENAYALVVRGDERVQRISALGGAADRSFGADYEFFERPEWRALRERYGLAPREQRVMDPSLLYGALASRAVDLIAGYTTDGRIEKLGLRVLDDDRAAIPPYDAIVLVSHRLWGERPDVIRRLRALEGSIDAQSMRRMNARVDSGASPRAAAQLAPICHEPQRH